MNDQAELKLKTNYFLGFVNNNKMISVFQIACLKFFIFPKLKINAITKLTSAQL